MENIIDDKAVFLNKNGKRLSEDNIKSMFKTYSFMKQFTGFVMEFIYMPALKTVNERLISCALQLQCIDNE